MVSSGTDIPLSSPPPRTQSIPSPHIHSPIATRSPGARLHKAQPRVLTHKYQSVNLLHFCGSPPPLPPSG